MGEILIREGRAEDVPALLGLIRELALYERCPDDVETTEEQMLRWGFGSEKVYGFFVAEKKAAVVGIALYYYKYSTWKGRCLFLEDLIVTEQQRGRGYGGLLFRAILDLAKREHVKRLEWQVLDWNETALKFYRRYGTTITDEWLNCTLNYQQIQGS